MTLNSIKLSILALGFAVLTGCASVANEDLVSVEISSEAVIAAQNAVGFMQIQSVDVVKAGQQNLYIVSGSYIGANYTVKVYENGEVLSVVETGIAADISEATFSE